MHIPSLKMVLVAVFGLALAGCEREGPAERAGESVDRAVEKAGEKIEDATERR